MEAADGCGRVLPPEERLSAQPWADRFYRDLLSAAIPQIVPFLVPWAPELLFLGGSAALGEAVGWTVEEGRGYPLSDLDLGVVTRSPVPGPARVELMQRVHLAVASGPAGTVFSRLVTLGFYEAARMDRQTPTPGLVDVVTHGIPLWGDRRKLGRFRVPESQRLPAWEALRLVGNRALELLAFTDPVEGPVAQARAMHLLGKAATGLWTGTLILAGRYAPGWRARATLLEGDWRLGAPVGVRRAAAVWAPFLEDPREAHLPPPEDRVPLFRQALAEWLTALRGAGRFPGVELEAPFLAEPCGVRERLRLWQEESRRAPGPFPRRAHLKRLWQWAVDGLEGTPEGRRMAAAALYWRVLPETLKETVQGIQKEPLHQWREGTRRYVGREVPPGPGCRERLRTALAT